MRRSLFVACGLGMLAAATAAAAQSPLDFRLPPVGKQAGSFMIRTLGIGMIPLGSGGSISPAGRLDAGSAGGLELDFSYFLTDHIAFELMAATARTELSALGSPLGSRVALGSVWVLPPTLTAQYHFMPHQRLSPYVGVGINTTLFYNAYAAGGAVHSLSLDNAVGAALQAGVDYNVAGHWFLNLDVKQIFLNTTVTINDGAIKARMPLNPLIVGAGIGVRF